MKKDKQKFKKERPPDQMGVDTDWRLFIAIAMPDAVQKQIGNIVEALEGRNLPVRWVAADSAHLTLHFLGDTEPERAELLRMSLSSALRRAAPFAVQTGGLGVFPGARKPRVIWQGLTGATGQLEQLHREIGRRLDEQEFDLEERRFHPHITLGRVRDNPPATIGHDLQQALNDPAVVDLVAGRTLEIPVTEVLLVRSYLERGGARHVPIERFPLRG
jgi:2'-5' RNA ligase